jgi:RNA polymerase sigma factor (sigma-70 family)
MYTEKQLVEGCLAGKREFQMALYKQFSAKMFAVCLRYARSRSEAEDILQEGFVKVYTRMSQFSGVNSLEGWIRRIVINESLTYYRLNKKRFYQDDIDDIKETFQTESFYADGEFTKEELLAAIDNTPEPYKVAFKLVAIEGYKYSEIAELLETNEDTVKSRVFRARKILKKELEKMSKTQSYGK